ncbi:MAG: 1-acyl-sn-glycerol-3-phosphate acyltransferase [Deltaproteobacteria bacterium]|nr:1-acyl-sn-glycerol-3-phosphate acyltransferase [Deltaproteobacteria bacterium]
MWSTVVKLTAGMLFLGVMMTVGLVLLLVLLPSRVARIRLTNAFGHVVGRGIMWISRCPIVVEGLENLPPGRPVIFCGNHTSIFDAFTSIWLTPLGTVGVAKRQILYYPFYGVIFWLAGHVLVDRGRTERAKRDLEDISRFLLRHRLHIFMWPEGTRAADGRLRPFKKGIGHLALNTRNPIMPMVTVGAHQAWVKSGLRLSKVPISIRFLPPIETSSWALETLDAHLEALHQTFRAALPAEQRPVST